MGGSLFFFVESKSFEFSVEEGGSFFLLRIFERSRDSLRSVFLGKESAKRLFSLMENLFTLSPLDTMLVLLERERRCLFFNQAPMFMVLFL